MQNPTGSSFPRNAVPPVLDISTDLDSHKVDSRDLADQNLTRASTAAWHSASGNGSMISGVTGGRVVGIEVGHEFRHH